MHKHALTWMAIFGVIALMFVRIPPMVAKQDSVLNTYGALVEVDALTRQQFVEPIADDRLVEGAIRGMMNRLDPYSGYIAPHELEAFERRHRGDYVGVGIEVGIQGGQPTVIAPIEGSPAARAGVRPGDVILSVSGLDAEHRSIFEIEDQLVGTPGTTVRLRVMHEGDRHATEFDLRRGPVSIRSVAGFHRLPLGGWDYMIDPAMGIAYVCVLSFRDNTMTHFDAALREIRRHGPRALVVDLRFNAGGVMQQGIAMVDRFVDRGVLLSTVNRHGAIEEYRATSANTWTDVKLAVLINGGSASSSEIVAGSLKDHHRAVIIGERSFGKGSVQHLINLRDHPAAIKLTTAYYRLPSGAIIHRTARNALSDTWGITPDVIVPLSQSEQQAILSARRAVNLEFVGDAEGGIHARDSIDRLQGSQGILLDSQLAAALAEMRRIVAPDAG